MPEQVNRQDLDNQEFMLLRQRTEKISQALKARLGGHLAVLRPLFMARKLLGTYIKSAVADEVPGSDKAFAALQERYAQVCERPFGLSRKLPVPLAPVPNAIEVTPYRYELQLDGKATAITCPTRWVVSFQSECSLERLRAMAGGLEARDENDMRTAIVHHLIMVILLEARPELVALLEDLRYSVKFHELPELGGLPVVLLSAPLDTFLPPDEFIVQITQLSGIPAFQEIVAATALERIADPLVAALEQALA